MASSIYPDLLVCTKDGLKNVEELCTLHILKGRGGGGLSNYITRYRLGATTHVLHLYNQSTDLNAYGQPDRKISAFFTPRLLT